MGKALRTLNFETQVIKAMLAMIYNKGKMMDEPAYNECERLRARIAEQKLRLEVHVRDKADLRAEVERLKSMGLDLDKDALLFHNDQLRARITELEKECHDRGLLIKTLSQEKK